MKMKKYEPYIPAGARTIAGKPRWYSEDALEFKTKMIDKKTEPTTAQIKPCHQSKPIDTNVAPKVYDEGVKEVVK